MKRLLLLLCLLGSIATATFAQIEYKIRLAPDETTYIVSLKSTATWTGTNATAIAAQVTISMPTGGFQKSNFQSIKGVWNHSANPVIAPGANPGFDYYFFILSNFASDIPFVSGTEVDLFSFENSGSCTGALEVITHATDPMWPENDENANVGNLMVTFGGGNGNNVYIGNYDPGSANCAQAIVDTDNDGIEDSIDQCPNTIAGAQVNASGCTDSDNDGHFPDAPFGSSSYDPNDNDQCNPDDSAAICDTDADNDGIDDSIDSCPNTVAGAQVNANGCTDNDNDGYFPDAPFGTASYDPNDNNICMPNASAASCQDTDNDGLTNDLDQCPNSVAGAQVNAQGCTDVDGDGYYPDASPTSPNYDPNDGNACAPNTSSAACNPSTCDEVEYFLELLGDGKTYQFSIISHVNWTGGAAFTSTAQASIKVPTGGFMVGNLTNLVPQVTFAQNSRYNSPAQAPNSDYISFGLEGNTAALTYQDGVKVPVFTFENTGSCTGTAVSLVMDDDAFALNNNVGANVTNQLTTVGGGIDINPCENDAILPCTPVAIVDTDGDGVPNSSDQCPNTVAGATVNAMGCTDLDGDGYYPDASPSSSNYDPNDGDECSPNSSSAVCNPATCSDIEYFLELLPDGYTYQVSIISYVTWNAPNNFTSTAQVSIRVPTGSVIVSGLSSIVPNAAFDMNSRFNSPIQNPGFDYLSFGLQGTTSGINYQTGVKVPVFTFQNIGDCSGPGVITLVQDDDPFINNNIGANVENQLSTLGGGIDINPCENDAELPCTSILNQNNDSDNDGVPDNQDLCPNTPPNANVNSDGCSDLDGDGYFPGADPSDPLYDPIDWNPCEPDNTVASCDDDMDGVPNGHDNCPNTQPGATITAQGCTDADGDGYFPDAIPSFQNYDPNDNNVCVPNTAHPLCDSDGDGISNDLDDCPNTPVGAQVNANGCSDLDGDGYFPGVDPSDPLYDPIDTNPCEPDNTVASCDDDQDGVPNGNDNCPLSQPGANVDDNGCTDDDGDGYFEDAEPTFANFDPNDNNVCIPNAAHSLCDSDGDGVPNDQDQCPNSPANVNVNTNGCSDLDGDGYFPGVDPSDPLYDPIDTNPCEPDNTVASCDDDQDGVPNGRDNCPNTVAGANVGPRGCTDIDGDGYYPDAKPGFPNYDPNDNDVCVPKANHVLCDSDGDGVPNDQDDCPNTPANAQVNANGCSDLDGDGYFPGADPSDPLYDPIDTNPCEPDNTVANCDDDQDGVPNGHDNCPLSQPGANVDANGCTDVDGDGYFEDAEPTFANFDPEDDNVCVPDPTHILCDSDGDGVNNLDDQCPNTPAGAQVNADGCSDLDGDGYFPGVDPTHPKYDPIDTNPCEPDNTVANCDDDLDGVPNGYDNCPFSQPGANVDANGCTDDDGDGFFPDAEPTFANFDPEDDNVCVPDPTHILCDSDGDGVNNLDDQCPNTPAGAQVNADGCSDLDGDGYFPGVDPTHPKYDPIDTNPCEPDNTVANCDDDLDGVPNGYDNCPFSQPGANVDANGCTDDDGDGFFPDAEPTFANFDPEDDNVCVPDPTHILCDSDGDGVNNLDDQCPNTPAGAQVNADGCSDLDGDGYFPGVDPTHPKYDPIDTNPCEPDNTVANCDDDLDGVPNGYDNCPFSQPGANVDANGCTDDDGDGFFPDAEPTFANYDPEDDNVCVPDPTHILCDSDGDGVNNLEDQCPFTPAGAPVNANGCSDVDGDGYFPGVDPRDPNHDPNDLAPCVPDNTVANCDDDQDGVPNGYDDCPFSAPNANVNAQGCTDDDGDGFYPDVDDSFINFDPEDDNVCVPDPTHILCDSDGDGVPNLDDQCPNTPAGAPVDANGCSDVDGDGYFPGVDSSDPNYDPNDLAPCVPDNTVANCDDDNDGVPNGYDDCPFSAPNANVNAQGCTDDDGDGFYPDVDDSFINFDPEDDNVCVPDPTHVLCDSDGDGVSNLDDQCPNTPAGAPVDVNGCSDIDGDGYFPGVDSSDPNYDPNDLAPCVPDNTVANCDDDNDGVPNGYDDCPFSAPNANVNAQGCTDDDGDGFYPDVDDSFINFDPEDDNVCVPDPTHVLCDSDGDGVSNLDDQCPNTPAGAPVDANGCSDVDGDGYFPGVDPTDPKYDRNDLAPCVPDNTVTNCDDDNDGVPNGYDDCPFSAPNANVNAQGCTDDDGDGFYPDVDDSFINYDPEDDNVCVPDPTHILCDSDGDGVSNLDDQCPNTPAGAPVDVNGCSDIDGDGYFPGVDPTDPKYDRNDLAPCVPDNTVTNCDDDNDGVPNGLDDCPFSAPNANVNAQGCTDDDGDGYYPDVDDSFINFDPEDNNICVPNTDLCDDDQDGVPNDMDQCSTTPAGAPVDANGCSDIDGDGYFPGVDPSDPNYDRNDLAPCVPNNTVTNCDDDNDGVPNGLDDCPFSAPNAIVNANGCTDNDGDGYFPDVDDSFLNFDPEDDNQCVPDNSQAGCGGTIEITLLESKVFLQGAYDCTFGLMRDDLRAAGHIPLQEPYTDWKADDGTYPFVHRAGGGGETISQSVLDVTGRNAIVDWIFAELRDKDDPTNVLYTRSGLVQRDGDLVDLDGVTPLTFTAINEDYYISVQHRNHLGAMSDTPQEVINGTITYDFTNPDQENWGTLAQRLMSTFQTCNGTFDNVNALWGGDADADRQVILEGGGSGIPDKTRIFFDVVTHPSNGGGSLNYSAPGYWGGDTNLDGEARLQGLQNDIDLMIFFNVMANPGNQDFLMNYVIKQQIPE